MKSITKSLLFGLLISTLFTSCKTSSNLSDSKVFQKRKYTKGYHVDFRKARPKNETKSVTASAFEELKRDENTKRLSTKEPRPIAIAQRERVLVTASAPMDKGGEAISQVDRSRTKWVKNIALPHLVSEIFSKPPEGYEEQPAPAGAIIGFIASIVGVFIAGIPLGILAVILCSIAIGKIERNPGMKGKGLAIAGIIIGIIAIVGALIVISNM